MERTSTTGRWVSVTAAIIVVTVCLIGPAATAAFAQSELFFVVDANGVERASPSLVLSPVSTDAAPSQVALSGDGQWMFVAYANSPIVSKIGAGGNNAAQTPVDVGGTPAALAADQTGDVLYV